VREVPVTRISTSSLNFYRAVYRVNDIDEFRSCETMRRISLFTWCWSPDTASSCVPKSTSRLARDISGRPGQARKTRHSETVSKWGVHDHYRYLKCGESCKAIHPSTKIATFPFRSNRSRRGEFRFARRSADHDLLDEIQVSGKWREIAGHMSGCWET